MKVALTRSLWMAFFVLLIVGGWEVFTFPLVRGAYSPIWRTALALHLSLVAVFVMSAALGGFFGFACLLGKRLLAMWQLALTALVYVILAAFVLPLALSWSSHYGLPVAILNMLVLAFALSYGAGRWLGTPA